MFNGRKAQWNGGWDGCGPFTYTILSEEDFTTHLERLSFHCTRGTADCASLQPFPAPNVNQDRYVVHDWDTDGGRWKMWGVFDGHAGHTTVDLTARSLPVIIMNGIVSMLGAGADGTRQTISPAQMKEYLCRTVVAFDESITQGVHDLFPGGAAAIAQMNDDEIRQIVVVDGWTHPCISRCLTGTTVLIALLDPARNLYVCSLGDCQAVLGIRGSGAAWDASLVSANHNGREAGEAARIHAEHPGEPECVLEDRVLGGIAVTRAIGDQVFKLPTIYAERVFDIADPSAHMFARLSNILQRNLTPPYVSNIPEVRHVDLSRTATEDTILILASDGLADLYEAESDLDDAAKRWVHTATSCDEKPAMQLLREGMGSDDVARASWYLTVEMDQPWLDDITVLVDKL